MAANRAKLSLRRRNKEPLATQPAETTATQLPTTLTSGGVAVEQMGRVSVPPDRRGHEEGERKDDSEDFRPTPSTRGAAVGEKRRLPQNETVGYLDMVSQDQLQLALAMSASLAPPSTLQSEVLPGPRERKRARHGKGRPSERGALPTSVITMSSTEKQKILAQRASAIVREARLAGKTAPQSGPALLHHPSQLGQRVSEGKSSTLWEMAGYGEGDTHSKFLVPALDLPDSENPSSPSPQPSPASHPPQTHSPPPQPPHIYHSPQCSPSSSQTHVSSRSPQRSTTSHLHTFHSSPPAPSTHSNPSPHPTSLPRGVQTLLSDLSSLVGSQLCSDAVITVEDGRGIPAHSAILACRCPMLAERLFHSLDKPVRLDFSQYSRATVVSFLRYLYTGTIPSGQNGTKSVKLLAMSLGMLEPLEESEERHPLVHTGASDGGQGVKVTQPSSLSAPHAGSAPYQPVGSRIQPLTPAMFTPHSSPSMIITRETTHPPREAPPILETAPPPCEALPTIRNESNRQASVDVQMSPAEDVISVASSPPERSPPHQSTSSPHHRFPVHTLSPSPLHFPVHTPSPPPHQSHSSPPSQGEDQLSSPLPLRKRIFRPHPLVGVASVPPTETVQGPSDPGSHDKSRDKLTGSHDQLTGSQDKPHDKTSQSVPLFVTPGPTGQRPVPESDTEITPMPDYSNMGTPHLKGECSKFGVRALPKKKMIAKLTEIYDYTHPLTDEDGNTVYSVVAVEKASEGKKKEGVKGRGKKKVPGPPSEKPSLEELAAKVREVITKDTKLYEDMLMYKPLELTYIQSRLKAAALTISRDSLMDVLDHLCITFSVPRQNQQHKAA